MSRPPCPRRIEYCPPAHYFKPAGIPLRELQEIELAADELEALRLADCEGLYNQDAAKCMGISLHNRTVAAKPVQWQNPCRGVWDHLFGVLADTPECRERAIQLWNRENRHPWCVCQCGDPGLFRGRTEQRSGGNGFAGDMGLPADGLTSTLSESGAYYR